VVDVVPQTARTKSIVLDTRGWPGHLPGQHVDVRLTAENGYQAQRSYSIASAPQDAELVLTVERLDNGEVSPYLTDVLEPGDDLELRGPIGGYFVWQEALGGPVLLIAGGSGVVPLRAMLRHHRATASKIPVRLLYSARTRGDLIYRDELAGYEATNSRRAGTAARAESTPTSSPRPRGHPRSVHSSTSAARPASWRRSPTRS
jgi:ferredoxin-NADP reductase